MPPTIFLRAYFSLIKESPNRERYNDVSHCCPSRIVIHIGLVADGVLYVSRPLAGEQGASPNSVRGDLDGPEEVVHAAGGLVIHFGEDELAERARADVGDAVDGVADLQIERRGLILDPNHIVVDLDVDLSLLAGHAVVGGRGLLADDVAANGQAGGGGDAVAVRLDGGQNHIGERVIDFEHSALQVRSGGLVQSGIILRGGQMHLDLAGLIKQAPDNLSRAPYFSISGIWCPSWSRLLFWSVGPWLVI